MLIVTQPKENFVPVEYADNRWVVRWDYVPFKEPVLDEDGKVLSYNDTDLATFAQLIYHRHPTFLDIKNKITEYYNNDVEKLSNVDWSYYEKIDTLNV